LEHEGHHPADVSLQNLTAEVKMTTVVMYVYSFKTVDKSQHIVHILEENKTVQSLCELECYAQSASELKN